LPAGSEFRLDSQHYSASRSGESFGNLIERPLAIEPHDYAALLEQIQQPFANMGRKTHFLPS
jgi:hypothetical protein